MRARSGSFIAHAMAQATIESGIDVDVAATGKAAVVAHYSPDARVTRSFSELVHGLLSGGYRVVAVSTSPAPGPLVWSQGKPEGLVVIRRANLGYDFGSWAVGMHTYPQIRPLDHVILTNDSMAGPFSSIQPILGAFEATPTEVWALTDSHQIRHHIQSYFVGFRNGVLNDSAWTRFFGHIEHQPAKMDFVMKYELGLRDTCLAEGYSWTAQYRAADLGVGTGNPTLAGWFKLLELGFPFVKRTIITNPETAPRGSDVPAVVRRIFGADLEEWL